MKKVQFILMAVLLSAGMGYSAVLLSQDYTGMTVGAQPTGTSAIAPVANTANNSVSVVNPSNIGSGEAMRMYDNDTLFASGVGYDFVPDAASQESAVQVHFQYSQRQTMAGAGIGLSIYVAEFGAVPGAASTKQAEIQLQQQSSVRSSYGNVQAFIIAPGTVGWGAGTVHTVDMFVNDKDAWTVEYVMNATTYALGPNQYSIWLDGVQYGTGATIAAVVDGGTGSSLTSENNLGRFVLNSGNVVQGIDYDIDNIVVTNIPEPATMGMLLLGAVTVLAVRRRLA